MTQHKISSRLLWIVITLLLVLIAFAAWAFSTRQDATTHSAKTHNSQSSQSADHAGKTSPPQAPNHSEVTNANNTLSAASTISTPSTTTIPVVNLSRTLPGLGNDAENYASTLESSAPGQSFRKKCQDKEKAILNALQSGNTAQAATLQKQYESWKQQERSDALSKADQAYSAGDWSSAVTDYQKRIALGDNTDPQIWWHMADALQKRDRSSAKETKYAAYLAYDRNIYSQKPDVTLLLPTLQILQKALAAEDDHLGEIHLLEAMYRAYPGNAQVAVDLKKTVMHYGFKVQKITPDTNQFPTRTCVQFTAPLSEAPDFHASNWVTFSPAQAHVAVVRENGGICISGLPAGSSTQMHIRAGLPAIAGAVLAKAQTVTLTLPNRSPSIITDTGRFIIPASLPPAVGFSSINISRVKLKINRVPERALLAFVANHPLLNQDESESTLNNQNSLTIWQGSADIPHFSANRLMHSILPLPKILQKPGLYAIEISPGDGTPNPNGGLNGVQLVLRTNLAPTVWQGRNGLYVQIRHYTDASPWSGVSVKLIAQDNDILQTVQTNADGIAFFPKPILQGSGG
ncbi:MULTISPECIES: tetratricopeptide repeat protein [Acidithiobacillus]|uniref:tetratricopeptide repeat protein n=1 Tax=Acidithiobacillus TaxID=119977 RepID=UPI001D023D1C|nr:MULTISPECIES: hypothetical protein [Acidithiobacillus]